ncbi:hypothetical protein POVWA2_004110 [Plasmodium ovale wallikeri]|uniref:Uncharacterized protein n=1 Tax=Plasmodium ovale wallikeri TaxID=864142 RepID=A0A1A8YGY8_PLAOA|nr:hypothetical protein POVWA1_003970 [Plasmodium ovale wallikeri]SBT31431.1 hypothetical protein POVWA2_004110 [Plasmodium ovale wallikeri]
MCIGTGGQFLKSVATFAKKKKKKWHIKCQNVPPSLKIHAYMYLHERRSASKKKKKKVHTYAGRPEWDAKVGSAINTVITAKEVNIFAYMCKNKICRIVFVAKERKRIMLNTCEATAYLSGECHLLNLRCF